ncbi:MAG: DUF2244 domain-containing protein [Alphaproteobacteria bacterium]|nr:DUF2244 domain-containing protein [Alphaproteobacteria bacterium]
MTETAAPLLELTLTPHRSLPRAGFLALMAALIAFNFVAGVIFLIAGAWPVVGFLGLDVLLVWIAFKLSYARARQSERLVFYRDRLTIRHRDHWGHERRVELQPYWLQVRVQRRNGEAQRLVLASHGKGHVIGSFLAADERERLAVHLREVLAALRQGRPLPAPPVHPAPTTSIVA